MTIATGLILARFLHILAASVLFGAALFPFYGLPQRNSSPPDQLPWLRRLLFASALLSVVSAFAWMGSMAAAQGGGLSSVVYSTNFGWVWPLRLLLGSSLVALLISKRAAPLNAVVAGSFILLSSLALTGNAANNETVLGTQHRLVDAIHLVASGAWIGALIVFARLLVIAVTRRSDDDLDTLHHALARFSGVGTISVAVLTLSGMLNPGFFSSSFSTTYGQVLLFKLALFVLMLVLAAINRFRLTPELERGLQSGTPIDGVLRRLRASIVLESALAVVILALVGVLGTLPLR